MAKLRFIVVGSGWRSLFYWRIAQALPERFTLCAMLCRTEEKAEKMHREYGVPVSTSAEQCIALHPDLVVVAVNKASIAAVSTEWLARGFAVLDSRSNFLFASTDKKSGGELYLKLKEKGVLVRHFDAPRISNWLRITIGTPDDMTALLRALDEILEG